MDTYDNLEKLKKLLDSGAITTEEYEREKARILSDAATSGSKSSAEGGWDLGIEENMFVVLMHASQFLSAFILPLIAWLLYREKSKAVDEAGKNILNFELSFLIYSIVPCLTCIFAWLAIAVGAVWLVFVIIAIIKAFNKEAWDYPLTIKFIK